MLPVTNEARRLFFQGCEAFSRISATGICIDTKYLANKTEEIKTEIADKTKALKSSDIFTLWRRKFGGEANLGSRMQLAKILFSSKKTGGLGFIPSRQTATGRPAVDEEVLKDVGIPFTKDFLAIEKLKKTCSTYLEGIARETVDGRLHTVFNQHIARTFRSSSDSPNLHNIPVRDVTTMNLVRQAFLPSLGHCLVEVDYSGIEVRVAACYNHDPVLIDYICNPEKDMHRDMAAECYKLRIQDVDKKVRYCGKNMFVFPQFYGDFFGNCATHLWNAMDKLDLHKADSKRTIRRHLEKKGITELGELEDGEVTPGSFMEHVKEVERGFWNDRFSVYTQWKKDWWQAYTEQGGYQTLTGFVIWGVLNRKEVINYGIQGSAFHCLLWSLIRLEALLRKHKWKTKIVGQIHDSIIADVHPQELDDFLQLIRRVMVEELQAAWSWIIVPLEVEADMTKPNASWASKSPVSLPA